ncbi:MAG: hypothetical protein ACOCUU_03900 [Nanoarchaeota archaeon]
MRNFFPKIKELIPIQARIRKGLDYVYELSEKLEDLWPVLLIQEEKGYLVGDGHHSTLAYMHKGYSKVPSILIENDEDIQRVNRGIFRDFSSLESIKRKYKKEWRVSCMKRNVWSFEDYLK